ncbi:hypothetical protein CYMTET_18218 [Cymbomonas tetramitiformis]|uniref:Uncharacterized protein n=1 Tax=Cymbomonas tetramitiformis TaxID=36881 RepID=A0AAE0G9V6_9CHLO|nr:hypothetical protein CYMTET_18218 [Cymbomonas tetramitiformis]
MSSFAKNIQDLVVVFALLIVAVQGSYTSRKLFNAESRARKQHSNDIQKVYFDFYGKPLPPPLPATTDPRVWQRAALVGAPMILLEGVATQQYPQASILEGASHVAPLQPTSGILVLDAPPSSTAISDAPAMDPGSDGLPSTNSGTAEPSALTTSTVQEKPRWSSLMHWLMSEKHADKIASTS